MTDKITGKGIPVNREMSPLDIQKLNKMYPCKPIGPICGKFRYTFGYTIMISITIVIPIVSYENPLRYSCNRKNEG